MKKEVLLVIIIGLFLLSYFLDTLVNPLDLNLATPFHFLLNPEILSTYAFTTASIFIRALAFFLSPLLLMSFWDNNYAAKGGILLVLIALMQLYALQDIATGAQVVPTEWSLSISLAGMALFIPLLWFFLVGLFSKLFSKPPTSPSD
jgi:hypothetical protein